MAIIRKTILVIAACAIAIVCVNVKNYRATRAEIRNEINMSFRQLAPNWPDSIMRITDEPRLYTYDTEHYKKRNDLCMQYGIDIISLDCDGVTEKLLPTWFNNGVNTMFPIEIGVWGDQFGPAREKFGKGMLGVGGMDKTALRKDKAAVDAEIERIKRLAAMGGFIPCPDHRLMPGSKFELVQYYAEEIKKIKL